MKTYSVLLRWQDGDEEQGEYGWSGPAADPADAEKKAREAMRASYVDSYFSVGENGDGDPENEEDVAKFLRSSGHNEEPFGGSVIDLHEGAIWRAAELETALRDLIEWEARMGGFEAAAWSRARALIRVITEGE